MKSGSTDSDKTTGSEAGTMVIQAPFIIAPTHQASASTKKQASASGDQASAGEGEGEGPLPLVLAGPSGAGKLTFPVFGSLLYP